MYPALTSRADILKMLDDLTEGRRLILERCGRLGAGQLNDPVYEGTWPLLKNLAHLAWAQAYMLAWIQKRPALLRKEEFPTEPSLDMETIRTALDEAQAATISFLKSQSESVLAEPCQYGRKGEQTVGGILFHMIAHEIHHRAFITHKLTRLEEAPRP